mgnify:CR=1 FL=1|jgi:hypothetical protein
MSLYWRKHPDLQTVELPQTIMRPFWHPEALQLDDHKFCMPLNIQRPVISAMLVLIVSLVLMIAAGFTLYEIYLAYKSTGILSEQYYPGLGAGAALLLVALLGLYFFARINQSRYICFDRQQHRIQFTTLGLLPRLQELPYDNLQGLILHRKSLFGQRLSILALQCQRDNRTIPLACTRDNPQTLAGFWSFLVQYMKLNAPLPDVPALHDYPNTTPGVLHHNTIDYS